MIVFTGLLIPLIGTTLGSGVVFLMKQKINPKIEKILSGFAAGVMIAASIWSLIIPSIEMSESQGVIPWLPATIGFLGGIIFLIGLDKLVTYLKNKSDQVEELKGKKNKMMALAVTLHNIPEGMAVGVAISGALVGTAGITIASALALSIGIAIQNFPEGAIISMPLKGSGVSKLKSFWYGFLSGIVEPIGGIITIFLTSFVVPILPYCLSFAAGAMINVVVKELIPDSQEGNYANLGLLGVSFGFVIMMILDVALG